METFENDLKFLLAHNILQYINETSGITRTAHPPQQNLKATAYREQNTVAGVTVRFHNFPLCAEQNGTHHCNPNSQTTLKLFKKITRMQSHEYTDIVLIMLKVDTYYLRETLYQ